MGHRAERQSRPLFPPVSDVGEQVLELMEALSEVM